MDATAVGIDVSKNQLDAHVRPLAEHFVTPRTEGGVAALVERLRPLRPKAIGLEAAGGFEALVCAGLAAAGMPIAVVNPVQVRASARTLIAELPELGQCGRREAAALAGLAPWTRSSGQWRGKDFGGGRASVRAAVFMGAMAAARRNPPLKAFRDKPAAGKPKLVAPAATAHELPTILDAILRGRTPWTERTA